MQSALSPDGNSIATFAFNSSWVRDGKDVLQTWDIETGEPGEASVEIELPEDFNGPNDFAWHPDGELIAADNEYSDMIYIWNVSTGVLVNSFEIAPVEGISNISWHPDGELLVVRGYTGRQSFVQIWSITESGRETQLLQTIEFNRLIFSEYVPIVWSPDGTRFATGTDDGAVIIFGEE